MPWKLRLLDHNPYDVPNPTAADQPATGDCWYAPWLVDDARYAERYKFLLSDYYDAHNRASRPPLIVKIPGAYGTFNIDAPVSPGDRTTDARHGWEVTGTPPNVTVHPSINAVGHYHGWLKDGVLSDDVDGRTFEHGPNWVGGD